VYKDNPVFLKTNKQANTKGGYERYETEVVACYQPYILLSRKIGSNTLITPFVLKKARIWPIIGGNMGNIDNLNNVNIVKILLTFIYTIC
jgi:hypothetical protein